MNLNKLFDVSNEVVIITGCAGQLGFEYVKAFINLGAKVVGLDLKNNEMINGLSNNFKGSFLFIECDVTNSIDIRKSLVRIQNHFGTPTVLINNAAIDSPPSAPITETGPFEEYPEASWDKVMQVNVKSVFLTCQIFGTAMKKNKKGSIINISSIYGIVSPDQSIYEYKRKKGIVFYKPVAYSASKSALTNLTKYLAVYWSREKIRVNNLVIAGVFNNQDQEFLDAYCQRIPIGRMANINEYNGALVFLASDASIYMTGSNLLIDGGWTSI